MPLETSEDELRDHRHELGDAELCKLQSADVCQESATSEQLALTSNDEQIQEDEPTDKSALLDNPGRLLHDVSVPDNATQQKDSLNSNPCDDNNDVSDKTVDLDMETFSSNETVLTENSAVTEMPELKYNNETALQLCEKPVLQSNNIHIALDAFLQKLLHAHETEGDKQQTIVLMEERPLSQIATNDRDTSHSFASVLRTSSPVVNICYAPVSSSSNDDFKDHLGPNSSKQFSDRQSFTETNKDHVSYDSINTQEVIMALKQCSDINDDDMTPSITYEQLIKEIDCSIVQPAESEIQSADQGAALNNGRDGLALRSNNESMSLLDICYPGAVSAECCPTGTCTSIVHDRRSTEVDISANKVPEVDLVWHISAVSPNSNAEQSGSYVVKDPDIHYMSSSLDCENSRFADIPVDSRAQRAKLTLDCTAMDADCSSNVEQTAQDRLLSLFSCLLDKTENPSKQFSSVVEFQQNYDCLNASLGGMELRDDMELIPVDEGKTGTEHSSQGIKAICDMNDYWNSINNITRLGNVSNCLNAGIYASLDGMELSNDMELIPIDNEKTDTEDSREGTKTISDMNNYLDSMKPITSLSSDTDSRTHDDKNKQLEFSQLIIDNLQMYKTASTTHHDEQLKTMSRDGSGVEVIQGSAEIARNCNVWDVDDNHGELARPSDSGIRLLLAQDHASVSNQTLQCINTTHDIGQEKLQCDLVLSSTEEVCDSNEHSEPTNMKGNTVAALVSMPVAEMQNVNTLISLETIHRDTADRELTELVDTAVSSGASEMIDSYFSETKNFKDIENEEHEDNNGCASTYTVQSSCVNWDFHIDAQFSEKSIVEHHPDLSLLNNDRTLSTVHYANEDSLFSLYEQSEKQLEVLTVDDVFLQTQRLELDDLTLTVTCFIPEESEELSLDDDMLEDVNDDDMLEDVNESEHLEAPGLTSSRKLTANDPVTSSDLAHYMDHNICSADKILPKHRSSEFMLSYLMPIDEKDETAEFTDDLVPDKSNSLQDNIFSDMKIEPTNNDEQKMAYNINVSPTVQDVYHLRHELTGKIQCDVAATCDIEESGLGNLLSNVSPVLDNGYRVMSFDGKQQIVCEESHSCLENTVERNNGNVPDRHSPALWFTANQQKAVGHVVGMNKDCSEDSGDIAAYNSTATTNVMQVSPLLDEYVATAEHTTLTINLPLQARSVDHIRNSDMLMPLAAEAHQYSSSTHSVEKTVQSNVSDEHFLDINTFKQNKMQGVGDTTEHLDNNSVSDKTDGLDMETYATDGTIFSENSAVTQVPELKYYNETELQLCERPVLQSNNIHIALDALLQNLLHAHGTEGDKQQTIVEVEEHPLSQIATSDRDTSHSSASVLINSSPMVVKASVELEQPAVDALTDFESILEQLHSAEYAAHSE